MILTPTETGPYKPPFDIFDADGVLVEGAIIEADTETGRLVLLRQRRGHHEDGAPASVIEFDEHNRPKTDTIYCKPPLKVVERRKREA